MNLLFVRVTPTVFVQARAAASRTGKAWLKLCRSLLRFIRQKAANEWLPLILLQEAFRVGRSLTISIGLYAATTLNCHQLLALGIPIKV